MKRFFAAFLLLTVTGFFVMAEGIGIDAGVRVDFSEVNLEGNPLITPSIEYGNSFGDIDVYADAEYGIDLAEEIGQTLYLEEELGYNLSLGEASTLSIIVNNQNNIYVAPALDSITEKIFNAFDGTLEPSVLFIQGLDFGDLYAQVGFPIGYVHQIKDEETAIGSYLTLGVAAAFGLGAELTLNLDLSPEAQYGETGLLISYEQETFYAELAITADSEFAYFTIAPEFEYYLNQFTIYAGLELGNIGGDDIGVSPFIGAKCSF
jgi:hypothetical protein